MSSPHRTVTLQFRNEAEAPAGTLRADLAGEAIERLLQQAERLGLPRHPDPSIATLLAAVRVRHDVPVGLYAALAAVLSRVYAATERLG